MIIYRNDSLLAFKLLGCRRNLQLTVISSESVYFQRIFAELLFVTTPIGRGFLCYNKAKPVIINSDQGCQFTSESWCNMLMQNDIRISMDGKGRWADNVYVERLWRTIKYEFVYLHRFETVARNAIAAYIDFYNTQRPHRLGYKVPDEVYKEFEYVKHVDQEVEVILGLGLIIILKFFVKSCLDNGGHYRLQIYFSPRCGQAAQYLMPKDAFEHVHIRKCAKKRPNIYRREFLGSFIFSLAVPTFPGRHQPSIIGAVSLTAVFGMGTGVSLQLYPPEIFNFRLF